jgi:hypothetical protein
MHNGKEIKLIDKIFLPKDKSKIKIDFLRTDSKLKQGIILKTKGWFEVNGQKNFKQNYSVGPYSSKGNRSNSGI